jgi:hypothetical protein
MSDFRLLLRLLRLPLRLGWIPTNGYCSWTFLDDLGGLLAHDKVQRSRKRVPFVGAPDSLLVSH